MGEMYVIKNPATAIMGFRNAYRFLSNFAVVGGPGIKHGGVHYPTVEHAYQAAKTLDPQWQDRIACAPTPGGAKRMGRQVPIRKDWEDIKIEVMRDLLRKKFSLSPFDTRLNFTGERELVEGNHWGDKFWGMVYEPHIAMGHHPGQWVGQNWLGRLLMQVREEL